MIAAVLCLVGCNGNNTPNTPNNPNNPTVTNDKILIAYFSLAENMENEVEGNASASMNLPGDVTRLANYIQEYTGGELFSIRTVKKYPNDFDAVVDENHKETENPALQSKVADMSKYDMVFIGYPVWATNIPRAIRTFIAENDLSDKTIVPFCSHDGYGAGSSYSTIATLSGANTLDGFAVRGTSVANSQDDVNAWLERIGIERPAPATQTQIELVVDDTVITGVLNDTAVAQEFRSLLPQNLRLSRYSDREYYGSINGTISVDGEKKRTFEKGEISYCPANNTFAVWFDKEEQTLGMDVIKIGEITSDYTVLESMASSIQMTVRLSSSETPVVSEQPETPTTPEQPSEPDTPTDGDSSATPTVPETPTTPEQPETPSESGKVLIAYFSLAENMENEVEGDSSASMALPGDVTRLAKYIQDYTGGDIFSIHTVKKYPNDFQAVVDENHSETSNPALVERVTNIDDYDTVFIGYPVWATNVPRAIRTFIAENDLSGKTVVPFCSHDGYGAGSSYSTIATLSGANTLDGFAVRGTSVVSSQADVNAWLERIGIEKPSTRVRIELIVGDVTMTGVLNDTAVAKEFLSLMPQTMRLGRYADREYYGCISGTISADGERTRKFQKGDITYCPANNTFAVWFDKEEQTLGMDVIKIGEITSDYTVLESMASSIQMTVRIAV
jgi:flavodoxin